VHCNICKTNEAEAAKYSKNGIVPLASGIRVDGIQKLERIVDHVTSKAHEAAAEASKLAELWEKQSDKHPWVNTLKQHRAEVINNLIVLCVDVYNDSLLETPTARSWPARSLASLRAHSIQQQLSADWDVELDNYNPPASVFHYRDPVVYSEMLHVIAEIDMKKVAECLKQALCVAIQIDGSADRQNTDNKFVVARYISNDNPCEIRSAFLAVRQSENTGAQGLLDVVVKTCDTAGVSFEKLVGITTDGEAANTGRVGGLWKLLADHIGHGLLTAWCCCHRSDLAMESAIDTVPELKIWLSNLTGVATYFRTSPTKFKLLHELFPQTRSFPAYFEVRFAEHVRSLILAILHNLPGCRNVWEKLSDSKERNVKSAAVGFCKVWTPSSQQVILTALMADITLVLQELHKLFQTASLILPDVLTVRDSALRKLNIISNAPMPGGQEEKILATFNDNNSEDTEELQHRRNTPNQYVTTGRRQWAAVRVEVVSAFINFLNIRLSLEDDNTITKMSSLLTASSAETMIDAGRALVETLFGNDSVSEFASSVCDNWPAVEEIPQIDTIDLGAKYSVRLRRLVGCTSGLLQKLLASILVLSPHSMTTERVISHYNQIKSPHRMSLHEDTMNARLYVSLNGVGTACYDPRPAVAEFLRKKDRRYREPEATIYK
jgi:hypothetical protein